MVSLIFFDLPSNFSYAPMQWNVPLRHLGGAMASPVSCQLCQQPVMLETARINEHGKAVHEECYVNALKNAKPPAPENSGEPNAVA